MRRIPDQDEDRNGNRQAFVPPPETGSPKDPDPFDKGSLAPPESPPAPGPVTLPPPLPPDSKRSPRGKHGKHSIRRERGRLGRLGEAFADRLWLRITGIVLLAIAAGTAGFLLLRPTFAEDRGPSPEDTVLGLFEAAKSGDCDAAVELVTDEFWASDGSPEKDSLQVCQDYVDTRTPGWVDDYTVKEVKLRSQEADTATVTVALAPEPASEAPPEWVASLVNPAGDKWLVDSVEVTDLATLPEDTDEGGGGQESEGAAGPASSAAGQPTPPPTGGGPELDRLAANCYQGDMAACDELFDVTLDEEHPYGSAARTHTQYGASCGGRFTGEVTEYCEDLLPDANG